MKEIVKHINDTNASYRTMGAGDAKNTDLFLDNEHFELFKDCGEQITVRFDKENLSKAILFIASILPRKYDCSATHAVINYSVDFVLEQLAILDGFFMVDGRPVSKRTQVWNARKDVEKKNGEIDPRFYFNGLMCDVPYNYKGTQKLGKFTLRNYLAGTYSDIKITKADDGVFDVYVTNALTPNNEGFQESINVEDMLDLPLQQIFYGAPGTGKSFHVDGKTTDENSIRTTFHPDSDYASFVGAYKPTMETKERTYTQGELISKLTEIKKSGVTYPVHKFSARYWESLRLLSNEEIKAIITACGFTDSMAVEVGKGIAIGQENANNSEQKRIVYKFVPQAFLKAYCNAWKNLDEPYYLVIEEINRGNCAQVFGDLFQLLDRNEQGYSSYAIEADEDIRRFISEDGVEYKLSSLQIEDVWNDDHSKLIAKGEDIANGAKLVLPKNLHIWATMNTSDQSLFPIDSAFKRRWDWEYMPIKYSNSTWLIDIAGVKYRWVDFQKEINKRICDATDGSEDKMLGDFFVKADANNIISSKLLLNKVIFYLWNDVCKDGDGDIFKINTDESDASKIEDIKFSEFFIDTDTKLQQWMRYLGIEPIQGVDDSSKEDEERQAQIEAGTDEKDAQKVKYSKPIYKAIIENMIGKLEGQTLAFFPNGFDWAFTNMPKSYTRTTLTLDSNANTAYVKLWIPAASGYSNSRECFEYLKEHNGETIIKGIAEKNGLQIEELGKKSTNPKPVLGWSMKLPMAFTEESTSANAERLLQLMTEVRSAFDRIITAFQKK